MHTPAFPLLVRRLGCLAFSYWSLGGICAFPLQVFCWIYVLHPLPCCGLPFSPFNYVFPFLKLLPPSFSLKKKKPFYFKIIMVSHVVVRSTMERSPICFIQLLPTATSCKTRVRCHSQMLTLIQSRHAMFHHHEDHPCSCPASLLNSWQPLLPQSEPSQNHNPPYISLGFHFKNVI